MRVNSLRLVRCVHTEKKQVGERERISAMHSEHYSSIRLAKPIKRAMRAIKEGEGRREMA